MFTGFTPETVDFLWGIRLNNNREWFTANKKQYVTTLYEPMKALGAHLFQPFIERSGNLLKVFTLRSIPKAWTTASSSGSPGPPLWKISAATSAKIPQNF